MQSVQSHSSQQAMQKEILMYSRLAFVTRTCAERLTSHAVKMLLLHQCIINTHFVRVSDRTTRVSGLWREKKVHDVSEPYIM